MGSGYSHTSNTMFQLFYDNIINKLVVHFGTGENQVVGSVEIGQEVNIKINASGVFLDDVQTVR